MRKFLLVVAICSMLFSTNSCTSTHTAGSAVDTTALHNTLPKNGELVNDKPAGKGWVNLLATMDDWIAEKPYWQLDSGMLHGDYNGGRYHNYAYTKTMYKDYELNVMIRMSGREANSGVCVRIHPANTDSVPGYQVDMGPGYWGCLWEEKRAGMVQQYPRMLADKLVNANGWNHYYIIAKGHHIQAWLNGVKTAETTMGTPEWDALVAKSKFHDWKAFGKYAKGHIALQDHGDDVWYRNIKIKEL